MGSIIAVLFYRLIKALEYETANPGQDFDEQEDELFSPVENPSSADEVRRPIVAVDTVASKPASPISSRQLEATRTSHVQEKKEQV